MRPIVLLLNLTVVLVVWYVVWAVLFSEQQQQQNELVQLQTKDNWTAVENLNHHNDHKLLPLRVVPNILSLRKLDKIQLFDDVSCLADNLTHICRTEPVCVRYFGFEAHNDVEDIFGGFQIVQHNVRGSFPKRLLVVGSSALLLHKQYRFDSFQHILCVNHYRDYCNLITFSFGHLVANDNQLVDSLNAIKLKFDTKLVMIFHGRYRRALTNTSGVLTFNYDVVCSKKTYKGVDEEKCSQVIEILQKIIELDATRILFLDMASVHATQNATSVLPTQLFTTGFTTVGAMMQLTQVSLIGFYGGTQYRNVKFGYGGFFFFFFCLFVLFFAL